MAGEVISDAEGAPLTGDREKNPSPSSAESCANQAVRAQAVIPHMCSLEGFCRGSGEDVRLAVQGRD
jgi:hypothetical protein